MPVSAKCKVKLQASVMQDFSVERLDKDISFKLNTPFKINKDLTIPQGSIIVAHVYYVKPEKRLHKSGYFLCLVTNYKQEDSKKFVDISQDNICFRCKRFDKLDKKDATITGVEITATTAASFFVPGVDLVYYFLKGAIQNTKAENRFKSGVHNAYDNSILWVFEKGAPIDLKSGDNVVMMSYKNKKHDIKSDSINTNIVPIECTNQEVIDIDDIDIQELSPIILH